MYSSRLKASTFVQSIPLALVSASRNSRGGAGGAAMMRARSRSARARRIAAAACSAAARPRVVLSPNTFSIADGSSMRQSDRLPLELQIIQKRESRHGIQFHTMKTANHPNGRMVTLWCMTLTAHYQYQWGRCHDALELSAHFRVHFSQIWTTACGIAAEHRAGGVAVWRCANHNRGCNAEPRPQHVQSALCAGINCGPCSQQRYGHILPARPDQASLVGRVGSDQLPAKH